MARRNPPGRPAPLPPAADDRRPGGFDLLTKHGAALYWLLRDPDVRIRDLATRIGTTQRRAQTIVNELVAAGLVERHRIGRRNRYVATTRTDGALAQITEPVRALADELGRVGARPGATGRRVPVRRAAG